MGTIQEVGSVDISSKEKTGGYEQGFIICKKHWIKWYKAMELAIRNLDFE